LYVVLSICIQTSALSQSSPVSLRPDVTITPLISAPAFCTGIAFDFVSQKLFICRANGDILRINYPGIVPVTDTLIYTVADHGISYLKGLLFRDSTLYLIGHNDIDTTQTVATIVKGVLQSSGMRTWSTVMETQPYQLGNSFFDHGMSGLCMNLAGDTLYFNSGSRTDHGEVEDNNGLYPNLREVPLTSAIFRIPADTVNFILPNDSALVAPFLFADGTRNSFSMAFNPLGHLFGCENSGDRDDPEELNLLQQGHHYGFPWVMGGNINPQQFPGYDPASDLLLNQARPSALLGIFQNDPGFPPLPAGLAITSGIPNSGPDADKYRDTLSGTMMDASDIGLTLPSFTSHKSPLGLVFDFDSLLVNDLKGHAFIFGNQQGADSSGNIAGGGFGAPLDPGEDMLDVQLVYDFAAGNYTMETHRIAEGFNRPVGACRVGASIFLLEYGRPVTPATIYEIAMPPDISGVTIPNPEQNTIVVYPNPVLNEIHITVNQIPGEELNLDLFSASGKLVGRIYHGKVIYSPIIISYQVSQLAQGIYFIRNKSPDVPPVKIVKLF